MICVVQATDNNGDSQLDLEIFGVSTNKWKSEQEKERSLQKYINGN
jgi:hypothetical protein